jgi:hypothetical protein
MDDRKTIERQEEDGTRVEKNRKGNERMNENKAIEEE